MTTCRRFVERSFRGATVAPAACPLASIVGLAAVGCMLVGCTPEAVEQHGLHDDPAHRPATLVDAVSEIERRASGILTMAPTAMSELTDIVGWLPELAADTPLERGAWDRVTRASAELFAALDAWNPARGVPLDKALASPLQDLRAIASGIDDQSPVRAAP